MFSKELNKKLDKYHLLNHPFYKSWNDGKLTRDIIKDYAPYEIGGPSVPLVVPMPLINPLPSTQTGSGGGLVGAASGGGTNDVSERLYKGTC